jgi:GT2 family glycosyltransferase
MDGGSTDGSLDLIREYCDKHDFARYFSSKDEGQADALNKGFAMAQGSILGWLNGDDCLEPNALATVASHFDEENTTVLVYGRMILVDADGKPLHTTKLEPYDPVLLLRKGNYVMQPSAFFRKDAFDAVGGLDKDLRYCMDYDLWLKLSKIGYFKGIDVVLSRFRHHPTSKTCSKQRKFHLQHSKVARRHGAPIYCKNVKGSYLFALKDPLRQLVTRMGLRDPLRSFIPKGAKLD